MELFKNTNYDFLGKKWPFIIASLVLTNTSQQQLANRLREALQRNGVAMSDPQVQTLAGEILSYAAKNYSGLLTDFSQLSSVPGINASIINTLRQECYLAPYHVMQV